MRIRTASKFLSVTRVTTLKLEHLRLESREKVFDNLVSSIVHLPSSIVHRLSSIVQNLSSGF